MRVLKMLWTLPNTLVGLVLGFLSFTWPRWDKRRALVFESDRGFRKLHSKKNYVAITLGNAIVTNPDPDEETMRHELVHVRQYETWGPLFALAYAFFWIKLSLEGKNPYRDNPFERGAREGEGEGHAAASARD
jgi:hypothetical protein